MIIVINVVIFNNILVFTNTHKANSMMLEPYTNKVNLDLQLDNASI